MQQHVLRESPRTIFFWSILFAASAIAVFFLPGSAQATTLQLEPGDVVRVQGEAQKYYVDAGHARRAIPNNDIYNTHFSVGTPVKVLPANEPLLDYFPIIETLPLTYRPGSVLLQMKNDDSVYAVGCNGVLHHVESPGAAVSLYGPAWYRMIKPLDTDFFEDEYVLGHSLDGSVPHCGQLVTTQEDDSVYYIHDFRRKEVTAKLDAVLKSDVRTLDRFAVESFLHSDETISDPWKLHNVYEAKNITGSDLEFFKSSELGFSFMYPKGWNVTVTDPDDLRDWAVWFMEPRKDFFDTGRENIVVSVTDLFFLDDEEISEVESLEDQGFTVQHEFESVINGRTFTYTILTGVSDVHTVYMISVSTEFEGYFYDFVFAAREDTFDEYIDMALAIVDSIEVFYTIGAQGDEIDIDNVYIDYYEFESVYYGFSMQYPENWDVDELDDQEENLHFIAQFYRDAETFEEFQKNIGVLVETYKGVAITEEEYIDLSLKNARELLPELDIKYVGRGAINALIDAHIFRYSDPDSDLAMTQYVHFEDEISYVITVAHLEGDLLTEFGDEVSAMLDSVEINLNAPINFSLKSQEYNTAIDHTRGSDDATIIAIEYGDMDCPFCVRFHKTMRDLLAAYPNDIQWVYRHYPLTVLHPNTELKSLASECAADQGAFWQYTDKLYSDNLQFDDEDATVDYLVETAQELDLNAVQLQLCVLKKQKQDKVARDMRLGEESGLSGTPHTILFDTSDGTSEIIRGAQPLWMLQSTVDGMLNPVSGEDTTDNELQELDDILKELEELLGLTGSEPSSLES